MDKKDIYRTAQQLIQQHGAKAPIVADERLQHFLEAEDVKASGVWLAIANAVQDLMAVSQGKTLH